ncbi:MAG: hypothetical protein ACOVSV_00100, partial [Fimbriimonadaceae bacterium]
MLMARMCGVVAVVLQDEIYALSVLYNSTNGDKWFWRNEGIKGPKWNFTSSDVNPCNTNGEVWQGIECSR